MQSSILLQLIHETLPHRRVIAGRASCSSERLVKQRKKWTFNSFASSATCKNEDLSRDSRQGASSLMPHNWTLQVTPSTRQKSWGRWLEATFLLTDCIGHSTQSSSSATLKRGCSGSVEGTSPRQFAGPSLPLMQHLTFASPLILPKYNAER